LCCLVVGLVPALNSATRYRGADLLDGHWWRLPASLVGSYHLAHVFWTLVLVGLVLATLERLVGSATTLLVLAVGHLVPTLIAFGLAQAFHDQAVLHRLDYGASAALACAAAALALLRRSRVFAAVLAVLLVADLFFSDGLTSAEHWAAVLVGLCLAALFRGMKHGAVDRRVDRAGRLAATGGGGRDRRVDLGGVHAGGGVHRTGRDVVADRVDDRDDGAAVPGDVAGGVGLRGGGRQHRVPVGPQVRRAAA
jgi:hypothetical protein